MVGSALIPQRCLNAGLSYQNTVFSHFLLYGFHAFFPFLLNRFLTAAHAIFVLAYTRLFPEFIFYRYTATN